jgi:hypothetical protein
VSDHKRCSIVIWMASVSRRGFTRCQGTFFKLRAVKKSSFSRSAASQLLHWSDGFGSQVSHTCETRVWSNHLTRFNSMLVRVRSSAGRLSLASTGIVKLGLKPALEGLLSPFSRPPPQQFIGPGAPPKSFSRITPPTRLGDEAVCLIISIAISCLAVCPAS